MENVLVFDIGAGCKIVRQFLFLPCKQGAKNNSKLVILALSAFSLLFDTGGAFLRNKPANRLKMPLFAFFLPLPSPAGGSVVFHNNLIFLLKAFL